MKHFSSLFYVCVAITFVGSAMGEDTAAKECTLEIEEGKSINDTMYERVQHCIRQVNYEHMGKNPSPELIRETFTAYCGTLPQLQQCLEGLDSDIRHCLDETQQARLRLYHHYEQLEVEVFCENNEADRVDVFHLQEESMQNGLVQGCLVNATAQLDAMDTVSVNGFMIHTYMVMHNGIQCLEEHKGQGHDTLLNFLIATTTKVMDRMKCIKDGADVLCKTVVDSH